jgi:hypothetical protein
VFATEKYPVFDKTMRRIREKRGAKKAVPAKLGHRALSSRPERKTSEFHSGLPSWIKGEGKQTSI